VSLRFVLLGHPVAHSLSPVIHHAAYDALGLPHRYELFAAPDLPALEAACAELRRGTIAGANVTIPWKREALRLADRADASAADVGAANVLVRSAEGEIVAYNTDVPALAREIGEHAVMRARALVLGSGGASLAAVAALARLGATEVGVSARRFDASTARESWPGASEFRRLGAALVAWPNADSDELGAFAADSGVVVQATSAGMHGAGPGAAVADVVPWSRLAPGTLAYDLVYNPADTEFLQAARDRGLPALGGLGMLVGQAALAFELWLEREPPRAAMRRAAEEELARRSA
jgi:shikimate dehydrogenase